MNFILGLEENYNKIISDEDKKKFEEMYLKFQYVLRKIAYLNEIPFDYIDDVVHDTFISYARYDYSLDLPPEKSEDAADQDPQKPLYGLSPQNEAEKLWGVG